MGTQSGPDRHQATDAGSAGRSIAPLSTFPWKARLGDGLAVALAFGFVAACLVIAPASSSRVSRSQPVDAPIAARMPG
jgi:hypothetical protein